MTRTIIAILAYLGLAMIPVAIWQNWLGDINYLESWGLAGAWVALLMIGACASTPNDPETS